MPELDFTSLTYHCPSLHQNSQCLLLTTLLLKPTTSPAALSRSLYRPTRTTLFGVLSWRDTAANCSEGRWLARVSTCGMKRIVGSWSLLWPAGGVEDSGIALDDSTGPFPASVTEALRTVVLAMAVGPCELAVRLLVISAAVVLGSGDADSVEVEVGCGDSRLRPLLPCIVGIQPFSAD